VHDSKRGGRKMNACVKLLKLRFLSASIRNIRDCWCTFHECPVILWLTQTRTLEVCAVLLFASLMNRWEGRIMWHMDPLLGNVSVISSDTIAVSK
jgi:hypothetical protein